MTELRRDVKAILRALNNPKRQETQHNNYYNIETFTDEERAIITKAVRILIKHENDRREYKSIH